MNRLSDYISILIGAYMIIVALALGLPVGWWTPLGWVVVWLILEWIIWSIKKARKDKK